MALTEPNIAFIGFGEAAQAFTQGFRRDNNALSIKAFDKKTNGSDAKSKRDDFANFAIAGEDTTVDACEDVDLVFSLVTADQAEVAAAAAARTNLKNALYLDCNSCSPETKRRAATLIESAGGRYVDVAVMTPVHPKLHKAPCLLAGPDAEAALEHMEALGMSSRIASGEVGAASVRKMVRSVMIKGMEALTLECFLAARKAGIETDVLASLTSSFTDFDWHSRAPYMIERAMTHGTRRAAEMEEVAKTLRDLKITPHVTEATIVRQREAGALGLDAKSLGAGNIAALTDAMLAAQATKKH